MNELHLQDKYLIPFFTNSVDGLGYREVKANTVDKNSLIIENDLCEFLSTSDINRDNYKKLLKKFKNDEAKMCLELIEFLKIKIKDFRNMALFLNYKNSSFTFKGFKFYLFNRSESETKGDDDFNQNIFSVVQELPYKFRYKKSKLFSFRPDISLFVNGIYLGYSELKSNYTNQNAKKNGRGKIIKDYKEAVISYLEIVKSYKLNEKEALELRKDFLKVFEKAIWISTTDITDTFILRDISKFFDEIKAELNNYEEKIIKSFKPYPLTQDYYRKQDKLSEIFIAHFSKKMIEKEILYYNFIEREALKDNNEKSLKNEKGYLISPRPKQKFGVDKIMAKIDEFLEHENEPDYFIFQLKEQLKDLSPSKRDELINRRLSYQNNRNIYSLLLQYAAGFGKSNIIGWSALQLKDLKKDGKYIYDKVMIIVDRVQLRDQLSTKMFNMNINNKMYIEAYSKSTFQKALKDDTRLVIVNLQKFGDMSTILEPDTIEKLKTLRVVFLIDEIHRSNSGSQNENLTSTFDEIQTSFDKDKDYIKSEHKKNLIIGFTATPSDSTLARFGEFNSYAEGEKIWKPFDSYTMREAIKDGYILNPLKGIVTISAKMYFELPEDELEGFRKDNEEHYYKIKKRKIYENPQRVDAIAKHIVQNLVQIVYKQIRGTAKAMLATTSITSAKIYKDKIEEHFKVIVQDKKYSKYKDAPIFIVYSSSQDNEKATTKNNGLSEAKVLQEFQQSKNGIIIVVDKLQTGFDEPKLHTLFLDKEIKGINAIQTISRVNRTTKYKKDCKIVDFSYKNVNSRNIKEAFEHFSDMVVSDFDPLGEIKIVDMIYGELKVSTIYKEYFNFFLKLCKNNRADPNKYMDLENSFSNFINSSPDKSKKLKQKINRYFHILGVIEYIISFNKKYIDKCFLEFFKIYNNSYNLIHQTDKESDEVVIYFDNKIGIVEIIDENAIKIASSRNSKSGDKKVYAYSILEIIEERNQEEENIGKLIEDFEKLIDEFFKLVKHHKEFNDLKAKINAISFDEYEVYRVFTIIYKSILRRNKSKEWEFFKKSTNDIIEKLCDDFEKSL
ncbi:Type I restriction-modification system, restriction subunit R [hydrothermal vent metagenome]|uniref:Type I restriction-modification system, restriction subunit R n=1 Tax=hydrothermal vent metagenome TaxID=652676 RepID=A0A1W1C610_9ZZZZ